jgi:uncharacterized RDD family membrane protein YckC
MNTIPTPPPFRHSPTPPAGVWIRSAAVLVDAAVLGIITNLVQMGLRQVQPSTLLPLVLNTALTILYFGFFYSKKGASPGKLIFGIRVQHEGRHPGFFRSALREVVGKFVSAILLFGGFLMSAFRKDKLALHDLFFGTRVVRSGPVKPAWVAAGVAVWLLNGMLAAVNIKKSVEVAMMKNLEKIEQGRTPASADQE